MGGLDRTKNKRKLASIHPPPQITHTQTRTRDFQHARLHLVVRHALDGAVLHCGWVWYA